MTLEGVSKKAPPGGGNQAGLACLVAAAAAEHPVSAANYSMICTMRRERGSTSTVSPFTTV